MTAEFMKSSIVRAGWAVTGVMLAFAVSFSRAAEPARTLANVADPCVVWNPGAKRWTMFFVRGGAIGAAESADGTRAWRELPAPALPLPAELAGGTLASPESVTAADGRQHLFVLVVPREPSAAARSRVVHFRSADFQTWSYGGEMALPATEVSGVAISAMPGGGWRLWYRDSRDGAVHFADSRDLGAWADRGVANGIATGTGAPSVFTWRGRHWLLVDGANGLSAYHSLNLDDWQRQAVALLPRGSGTTKENGRRRISVVVARERAVAFVSGQGVTPAELVEKEGALVLRGAEDKLLALESPDMPRGAAAPMAATARDPQELAVLHAAGSREIRTHDPSTLAFSAGEYWVFHTGRGIPSWHSKDLRNWTAGPAVFESAPAWVAEAVPENRNANFWAPDIIKLGDRFLLYYAVSSFGKRTSAIALATNRTLDPAGEGFAWRDEGIVVRSGTADNFNAIDPAVFHDTDGKLWLTFGSYWSGIKLLELDPATGTRITGDAPPHAVAHSRAIEAAFLYRHGQYYYLFVNHGWCCRGVNSTYHIRVGRSATITGPYVDRDGRGLLGGGGTVFAQTEGPFVGPGHAAIMTIEDREWFGCHFYDATQLGRPTYALRPLNWDAEEWPVLGAMP